MRLESTDDAVGDLVRLRRFIEEQDPQAANRTAPDLRATAIARVNVLWPL